MSLSISVREDWNARNEQRDVVGMTSNHRTVRRAILKLRDEIFSNVLSQEVLYCIVGSCLPVGDCQEQCVVTCGSRDWTSGREWIRKKSEIAMDHGEV